MPIAQRTIIEADVNGTSIVIPLELHEFMTALGNTYKYHNLYSQDGERIMFNRVAPIKYLRSTLKCSLLEAKLIFEEYAGTHKYGSF